MPETSDFDDPNDQKDPNEPNEPNEPSGDELPLVKPVALDGLERIEVNKTLGAIINELKKLRTPSNTKTITITVAASLIASTVTYATSITWEKAREHASPKPASCKEKLDPILITSAV